MTSTLITSQDYINDEIVAEKQAAADYLVVVSPSFEIGGESYRVVLDGHHSLAAAIIDGVAPEIVEADAQDHDAICLLTAGNIDDFLMTVHMGADYRDAITGNPIW